MFLLYRNLKTREKTEMMIETEGEIETAITIGNYTYVNISLPQNST